MDFESLKSSASNFDKITKALEASTEKPETSGSKSNKYQERQKFSILKYNNMSNVLVVITCVSF